MQIAREYGIPQVVITRHRNQLGIRNFEGVRNDRIKARWESVSFGQYPDWEIADKLRVHITTVIKERRKRKILPYLKMRDANLLNPDSPRIVKRIQTTRNHRRIIQRDIDWSKIPLGTKPDETLAREFGVSPDSLRAQRLTLGIPSYKKKYIDTDWSKIPLGKIPDWRIAQQLGKSVDAINVARSSRRIAPFAAICKTTEGQPCNAPEGMIDLYWHENNIPHEFQVRFGRFIADWKINQDTIVEYCGWEDHPKYGYIYLERLARKKLYYESLGYKVLVITRRTLKNFKPKGIPA